MVLSPAFLKKLPDRGALTALVQTLEPDGQLASVRALRGGIGCSTHAVRIQPRSGPARTVVLRRYHDNGHGVPAETCRGEWRTLELLADSPVSAPKPVWLDAEGRMFGQPALVETRLPGRAELSPVDMERYVSELARALVVVHSISAAGPDWSHATDRDRILAARLAGAWSQPAPEHEDIARVQRALRALWPTVRTGSRRLLHGDYWPGNTLWLRGRLVGVVDWESPQIGEPAFDVAYCRQDLAMLFDLDAAERFLDHYERASGTRMEEPAFWDLVAIARALPDVVIWLPGYHDLGRRDITPAVMRERHQTFIAQALLRAR